MGSSDVLAPGGAVDAPEDILTVNMRVFDSTQVLGEDSVLLRGGLIAQVGLGLAAPPGVQVVDGSGGTLLPGLIDAHVHAQRVGNLAQALAFGVTTELDMFCPPPHLQQLRAAATTRSDVADFRSAGIGATAPGGHPTQLVDWGVYPPFPTLTGPEQAEEFLTARTAEGIDYLKVFVEDGSFWGQARHTLSPETVRALVAGAHARGLLVVAHADTGASARMVLDAGADALAHHPNDADPAGELVTRLSQPDRFVIPTLQVAAAFAPGRGGAEGGNDDLLDHPALNPFIDDRTRRFLTTPPPPPPPDAPRNFTQVGLRFDGILHITRLLHEAGVPLLAGTDSIPVVAHGLGLHRELELLVEAGLAPTDALAAATSAPARCFALHDRGRIAAGPRADLLLVDGDPTTEITATRNIRAIWRAGARLDRDLYRTQLHSPGSLGRDR